MKEKKPVAILLAGGESTRFWPLLNKNTFTFFGKPFLYWHYRQLMQSGFEKCIVVANKNTHDTICSVAIPEGLKVEYAVQKGQGMGYAVAALDGLIREDPVLILNASDHYSDNFITKFVQKVQGENAIILGAVHLSHYFPGGYLLFNADKTVAEIIEKPPKGKEPSDIGRIVADFYPKAGIIIDAVKAVGDNPTNGYENAINAVIKQGQTCLSEITEYSNWSPIKFPWHVLDVMNMMFCSLKNQQIHPSVEKRENVIIEGPVIIEEGVKIYEGTKIVGPAYIGKNTIIGNNNIFRKSSIGSECVTGFHTDITRSSIGDNCWFHSNYIGDSVIADNVSMGSGTVCANLRLDDNVILSMVKGERLATGLSKLGSIIGQGVRIGVNASIMPGVKIGAGSFIGAGATISEDISENKFAVMGKTSLAISENTKSAYLSRDEFRKAI